MKVISCLILFLFLSVFIDDVFAQTKSEIRDEDKLEKNIKGNRFRIVNNYVNFGIGFGRKFNTPINQSLPISAGYNFRIKRNYFHAGFTRSEMPFIWGNYTGTFLNDLHIGYCIRRENKILNFAYIFGPSLAWGLVNNIPYRNAGFYVEAHFIRKIYYDIGVGFAPFMSFNAKYPFAGLRLEFFMSSSYQGRVNAD